MESWRTDYLKPRKNYKTLNQLQSTIYMHQQHNLIIQITNDHDHQNQCNQIKQIEGIFISSQGRYTITLSRYPKDLLSYENILQFVSDQYGIEQSDYEIANLKQEDIQPNSPAATSDLQNIFRFAKINISGNIAQYKQLHSIGPIDGGRILVNDGNTILLHFTDSQNNYILFHEIKY